MLNHHKNTLSNRPILHQAAAEGNVIGVRTLLDQGANIEATNFKGLTPLMFAAARDHAEVVKILIDAGANEDAISSLGNTTLMLAAANGYDDIIKLLIKNGANITLVNKVGQTVLQLYPNYFHQQFLLPIFKEAIDEGNIKVLLNLCKYDHYRAELLRPEAYDTPHSIVKEFQGFLREYNTITVGTVNKAEQLNDILVKKLEVITTTEASNSKSIGKILKYLTDNKAYSKSFNIGEPAIFKLIMEYAGWQKQWNPMPQLKTVLQEGKTYQSIADIVKLIKSSGIDVTFISNKNLDNLQQVLGFFNEVKQDIIINKFPPAILETFTHYPQVAKLFARDENKASQFILIKLIAKILSYDIAYYSDATSIIHFSGGDNAIASYKIYETSGGQVLISKLEVAPKVTELTSVETFSHDSEIEDEESQLVGSKHTLEAEEQEESSSNSNKISKTSDNPSTGTKQAAAEDGSDSFIDQFIGRAEIHYDNSLLNHPNFQEMLEIAAAEGTVDELLKSDEDIDNSADYHVDYTEIDNSNQGRQIITVYQHSSEGWWAEHTDNNNFELVMMERHLWWEMQTTADVRSIPEEAPNYNEQIIEMDIPVENDSLTFLDHLNYGSLLVAIAGVMAVSGVGSF